MTQVETGHFLLIKTPRPGLIPLQDAAPFQSRIFFTGASAVSWLAGTEPFGGTYISWNYNTSYWNKFKFPLREAIPFQSYSTRYQRVTSAGTEPFGVTNINWKQSNSCQKIRSRTRNCFLKQHLILRRIRISLLKCKMADMLQYVIVFAIFCTQNYILKLWKTTKQIPIKMWKCVYSTFVPYILYTVY
jgi:hypothetical protein